MVSEGRVGISEYKQVGLLGKSIKVYIIYWSLWALENYVGKNWIERGIGVRISKEDDYREWKYREILLLSS